MNSDSFQSFDPHAGESLILLGLLEKYLLMVVALIEGGFELIEDSACAEVKNVYCPSFTEQPTSPFFGCHDI